MAEPVRGGSWARRAASLSALVAVTAGASACDPCASVVSCRVPEAAPVEGRIVESVSGAPVGGVTITVIADDGERFTTTTGSDGAWRAVLPAREGAGPRIDVMVAPPGMPGYRVNGIDLRAFDRRGDGNVLETWMVQPSFPILAHLFVRGAPSLVPRRYEVTFIRTGGVTLSGNLESDGRYVTHTDSFGNFRLLGREVLASGEGQVVGDIEVEIPGFGRSTTIGVALTPSHVFRDPWRVIAVGTGPSLEWVVEFRNWIGLAPVPDVEMEFRRTGGIAITPTTYVTRANEHGHAALSLIRPLAEGTVIGDLYVRPPAPMRRYVVRGLRLDTFNHDNGRFLGVYAVGTEYDGPPGAEPHP